MKFIIFLSILNVRLHPLPINVVAPHRNNKCYKTAFLVGVVHPVKTWSVSRICRYLIALNIIPVYRNSLGDIRFSWISCRTFLFLMASYFPSVTIVILILIQSDFVEEYIEKSTLIYLKFEILIIILSFFIMFALAPIQVLCLCKPYVKLQSISMSKSLKFLKKDDLLELLPANIISTGFVAFIYAHYMEVCHLIDNDNSVTCFTNLFLAPLCFLYLGVFFLVISYFHCFNLVETHWREIH